MLYLLLEPVHMAQDGENKVTRSWAEKSMYFPLDADDVLFMYGLGQRTPSDI